ncbi:hypothetical protein N0V94_005616 [Neodidymelliopsis sp. IMI 364377]|nr:hypothetical protein N0V94_005616 [Neodidymelliopsis sp. IMI 364377]
MYIGANLLLPAGYDTIDKSVRYPVIYNQGHWPAGQGAYNYGDDDKFTAAWDAGIILGTNTTAERPAPKFILVTFRHEAPYCDDSYAVNTANLGPYGGAINEELIPLIEDTFRTIRAPYARIQDGGSTGGWESIANVIYRPDLFVILATVAQENHWKLTFGTASRSFNQWDIWNAVFGVQGYNNYPLEPWDKVTGEIYPEAVEYWKPFDLSNYIVTNFNSSWNLGTALAGRIFVYVGTWDDYFLNEGVMEFQKRTDAVARKIWDYLELVEKWIQDHAPGGSTSLAPSSTAPSTRGNIWEDVIESGGRKAAIKRQAEPKIEAEKARVGQKIAASVGRWDPGVKLTVQWILNSKPACEEFAVQQNASISYVPTAKGHVQLLVTGAKRNYVTETRKSQRLLVGS